MVITNYLVGITIMGTLHTHTLVLRSFWILSGITRVSLYQKGKMRKVKTIWIY